MKIGDLYAYTGGKDFDPAKPTVVFIHGVLNDHSVWILQSRYLAHHGWNVLAIDLPGHCKSGGEPPASVEDASAAIVALLDAAGVQQATLVGHSFGSLIALETAARAPERDGAKLLAARQTAPTQNILPDMLITIPCQREPWPSQRLTIGKIGDFLGARYHSRLAGGNGNEQPDWDQSRRERRFERPRATVE